MHNGYITLSSISQAADMGSQMQQYACLLAIAKVNNKKVVFPESCYRYGFSIKLANIFDIELDIRPDNFFEDFVSYTVQEDKFPDERAYNLSANVNYNFSTIFHTHHYWSSIIKTEMYELPWNKENYNKAIDKYNKLYKGKDFISMHFRRGAYVNSHLYCNLDYSYYFKALELFTQEFNNHDFLIFSDDVVWTKHNQYLKSDKFNFVDVEFDAVDMILMSMCKHNIIANSSFSWWAAFKNKNENKKVVCPKNYIKENNIQKFLNGEYYLPEWTVLENNPI